jgi:tetratricopeptide (TPR) repeat protein
MMVGQGKVAGHSQTDFKHRRGFSKIKALQNKSARTNGETSFQFSIETGEKRYIQEDNHWEKRLKVLAGITLLAFVGILTLTLQKKAKSAAVEESKKPVSWISSNETPFTEEELARAYRMNVSSGQAYLQAEKYEKAEEYFQRALHFEKGGAAANVGLLEVVCRRCYLNDINCEGAKVYLDRVKANKWLDKATLKNLEQLIQ